MSTIKKQNADSEEIIQLVSFKIGKEEFGVDIHKVQEINRMMKLTEIPNSPDFVDGVINLRGRVIPVVDLRSRLFIKRSEHNSNTRIIVVELNSNIVGFIVDEVSEVLRIPSSIIEPPPTFAGGRNSEFISAVGKLEERLLILLDLEKIFNIKENKSLRNVA